MQAAGSGWRVDLEFDALDLRALIPNQRKHDKLPVGARSGSG
jgi:hypothetical protein